MKFKHITYLVSIFSYLSLFQINANALTISPHTVVIQTDSGQAGTTVINVINEGNATYQVNSYPWDIGFDKNGNRIYKPIGSFNYSIAKYVKINPEKFILKSKESQEVKVSIMLPKDMSGGNQAIAFFEAIPIDNLKVIKSDKLKMGIRLGGLLLQETKGTIKLASKIKKVDVILPTSTKPLILKLNVSNEGNSHIFASAMVAIMGINDTYIGQLSLNKILIFPKKNDTLIGTWNGVLSKGFYHALITYQYGEDKNIVIDKTIEVK